MQSPFDANYSEIDIRARAHQSKKVFFKLKENDFKWINILFLLFTFIQICFLQRISYSSLISILIVIYCSYTIYLLITLNDFTNEREREQNEIRMMIYNLLLKMWRYYKPLFVIVIIDIIAINLWKGKEIINMIVSENIYEQIFFYLFSFFYLARITIMGYTLLSFSNLFDFISSKTTENEINNTVVSTR